MNNTEINRSYSSDIFILSVDYLLVNDFYQDTRNPNRFIPQIGSLCILLNDWMQNGISLSLYSPIAETKTKEVILNYECDFEQIKTILDFMISTVNLVESQDIQTAVYRD